MFEKDIYIGRRRRLAELMPDSLLVFIGHEDSPINYASNIYRFRQDSTFIYLFGIDKPNLAATIDTATGESILYGDTPAIDEIVWTGPQLSVPSLASMSGMTNAAARKDLSTTLESALKSHRTIHYVPPYRAETIQTLSALLQQTPAQVIASASKPLIKALVSLRSIKEQCEIDDINKQMTIATRMHTAAMHMATDGTTEREIDATLTMEALRGGPSTSFPSICTVSGQFLHNIKMDGVLRDGQLLLVDAGAESNNHYATDVTRTTPVGGCFSNRQKEIYQIVLNANHAVANGAQPGTPYRDLHLLAARIIVEGLKDLDLMTGDIDEAVAQGAYALFMPHGVGHMMGLDVHDMESYGEDYVGYDDEIQRSSQLGLTPLRLGRRLQAGFCVTDEPGIYFIPDLINQWEACHRCTDFINYSRLQSYKDFGGIRIEDDIYITPNGPRVVGGHIPSEIDDVEKEVSKQRSRTLH